MQAHKIGEQAYKQFKKERLETSPPKKKFHDALKLQKLKTFSSLSKKKTIDAKGRAIILRADRSLIGRMIVMGQTRKIEVKELLCHSLGPLPWALATPGGFPRKTSKAALATYLQKDIQSPGAVPQNPATVIDGMSLVQKLNVGGNQTTFGGVATALLSMALHEGSQSGIIESLVMINATKSLGRVLRMYQNLLAATKRLTPASSFMLLMLRRLVMKLSLSAPKIQMFSYCLLLIRP